MTTLKDNLTQILTIAADCDDDVTADLAQKALDCLSVDLEGLKMDALRTYKNKSGYQIEDGSHDWENCALFFDHLSPLITRAPNEDALRALDRFNINCLGFIDGYKTVEEDFETIRAALGGNNE